MSRRRLTEHVKTKTCTTESILRHPLFARGLADVREGRPFNVDDDYAWEYGRGRQFGALVPLDFPVFDDDGKLSAVAVEVYRVASRRRWIL
jgi:hypothetical protein